MSLYLANGVEKRVCSEVTGIWRALGCRHDDLTRSQLRAQLAEMRPSELVLPAGGLSEATQRVLKAALRGPRTNRLAAPASAADVIDELDTRDYFSRAAGMEPGSRDAWPSLLKVRETVHLVHTEKLSAQPMSRELQLQATTSHQLFALSMRIC